MRFLFILAEQLDDKTGCIVLNARQSHRLAKVLRVKVGTNLLVRVRSTGSTIPTVVRDASNRRTVLETIGPIEVLDESGGFSFSLGCALLKHRNFEFLAQKATELGVHEITPLLTEHCAARNLSERARERLLDIIDEACMQCGRARPTVLSTLQTPMDLVESSSSSNATCYVLDESLSGAVKSAADLQRSLTTGPVVALVGPEGGFSAEEQRLCLAAGAHPLHLPGHVLRSETAAMAVAALAGLLRN